MRRRLAGMLFLLLAPTVLAQVPRAIPVRVDPRVELLSIVFRLAGAPEYSQGRLPGYNDAVDTWFAPFQNHAVIRRAKLLRTTRGISYDAVASFAIHLDGIDPPRFAKADTRPERLESRWTKNDALLFLSDLAAFTSDAKVKDFFASQNHLYTHAEAQMQRVAEKVDMAWFGTFFGERPKARFQVVLGLLNGGGNYGPSALLGDGSEDLYAILGCWEKDDQGLPHYDEKIVPTLVHEYCHSYCNPLVDAHYRLLSASGNTLFSMTEASMRRQAYGNGRTLLCESLVRACVIRYRAKAEGAQAAADEAKEQTRCSFYWAGELAELLAKDYEGDRKTHATLQTFGPQFAKFYAGYVPRFTASLQTAPKVQEMTPAIGAKDVDPATTTLMITFDRPMQDRMWSVVGGGEHFPEIKGPPTYDKERRVLTLPVQLKPAWTYELWLNRGRFDSFRAEDGTPLESVHVTFETRAQ
jgi:hypothetical protein